MAGWYYFLKPYFQWSAVAVYTAWMFVAVLDHDVSPPRVFFVWVVNNLRSTT